MSKHKISAFLLAVSLSVVTGCGVTTPTSEKSEEGFFSDENFNIEEVDVTEESEFAFDEELLPTDFLAVQEQAEAIPDLRQNVFFFNYNSETVEPSSFPSLDAHAQNIRQVLLENPNLVVVLEGHTDDTGSREYNLSLGQRRAESVGRYLRVRGVPRSVIRTISFGEESPAVVGNDEAAWAQNRRVSVKY